MKIRSFPLILALALLCCFLTAFGQRTHVIEMDDYFTQGYIGSCKLSPNGEHIAYTELRWNQVDDGRNNDIWVVDVKTKEVRRLTFDFANDGSIQWSPDSRWIYFTSARGEEDVPPLNGESQVWRVSVDGGPEQAVTRFDKSVHDYALSADGKTLYYVTGKDSYQGHFKDLREKYDDLEYGHGVEELSVLWKLDFRTWHSTKLVDDDRVIGELAVTADEKRIAMITKPDGTLLSNEGWSRVDIYDTESEAIITLPDKLWREEAPSPYGWLGGLSWNAAGTKLAFSVDFDGYPAEMIVAEINNNDWTLQRLTRPGECSLIEVTPCWLGNTDELCFVAEDHARARVYGIKNIRNGTHGGSRILTPGDVVVENMAVSKDGKKLVVGMSTVEHPADLFMTSTSGSPKLERLTRVNPQVDMWQLPRISIIKWTSSDGQEVEGILELPYDYREGDGPLPLMVELHGGPTASTLYRLRLWIYGRTLPTAWGWAVFSPNYRGSTGFGDKFLTDLIGNENNLDVADILTGVDALVEQGIADPEKLAVQGWSNGGYLTNCLITKTDRFKAASSGAGMLDASMQWGIEDTPGHVINYQRGSLPWTNIEQYRSASPLYDLDKVRTPTLIHVGINDPRVPPEHSIALHRALYRYLNVPTELIMYPGAGHGLSSYKQRKAKMEWDKAWFDYYVIGKESEEKPVKPDM